MDKKVSSLLPFNQEVMSAFISMLCNKEKDVRVALQGDTQGALKKIFPAMDFPKNMPVHVNSTETWHITIPVGVGAGNVDLSDSSLDDIHGGIVNTGLTYVNVGHADKPEWVPVGGGPVWGSATWGDSMSPFSSVASVFANHFTSIGNQG